ncbi:MAG: hypothetical protein ACR2MG_05940 [Pyrinomonadaceae bacterium]
MQNKKALVFGETEGFDKTFEQSNFKPNQVSRQGIQQALDFYAASLPAIKIRENQIERRKKR